MPGKAESSLDPRDEYPIEELLGRCVIEALPAYRAWPMGLGWKLCSVGTCGLEDALELPNCCHWEAVFKLGVAVKA